MKHIRNGHGLMIAIAMTVALTLSASAWAENDDQKDKKNDNGSKQAKADQEGPRELKAFDLEHRKPQEIQQLLALKSQSAQTQARPGGLPGQTPQQRTAGFRGMQNGMAFAADNENNVLFVRGSEDQIKEVEELVDALDVSKDKLEKKEIGDTQLIPIGKDQVTQIRTTLGQLQLKHQVMPIEDAAVVVICHDGSDEQKKQAKQVEEVLSKLNAGENLGKNSKEDDSDKEE